MKFCVFCSRKITPITEDCYTVESLSEEGVAVQEAQFKLVLTARAPHYLTPPLHLSPPEAKVKCVDLSLYLLLLVNRLSQTEDALTIPQCIGATP